MKTKIAITLALAFLFCGFESVWCQTQPAKKATPVKHVTVTAPHKTSIKSVFASVLKVVPTVLATVTDKAEYISAKVADGFMYVDKAADAAEVYLSNVQ